VRGDTSSFLSFQKNANLISIVSPTWLNMDSAGNIHAAIDSTLLNPAYAGLIRKIYP
jgi:hypothetical protein